MTIDPIDAETRHRVVTESYRLVALAEQEFARRFPRIPVLFDLRGGIAGMYRVRRGEAVIRYNPWLFAKYFADSMAQTVPHEIAHFLADRLYGMRNIRPHGREWRALMRLLGAEPRVTGDYDLAGIPQRRQQRFEYHCACGSHRLSACRHNRLSSGRARYVCKRCGTALARAG